MQIDVTLPRVFKPLEVPARYKGIWGGRGCCHPDTLVDTPNGHVKISEFSGGDILAFDGDKVVIARALAAREYDEQQLYRVVLNDDREISVTDEHKFLTSRGWLMLRELRLSDELYAVPDLSEFYPRQTSSGNDQLKLRVDVPRCSETRASYLGDCYEYFGLCGLLLQWAVSNGLVFSPLPAGGRQHNYRVWSRAGAPEYGSIHNPLQSLYRPSNLAVLPEVVGKSFAYPENYSGGKTFERLLESFRLTRLFHANTTPAELSVTPCQQIQGHGNLSDSVENLSVALDRLKLVSHGMSFVSPNVKKPILTRIKRICKHDRLKYWDLHVPILNNYLSNGIVNHNSGKSHNRAEALIFDALENHGLRAVCIREVQKTLKESSKRLLEDKLSQFRLGEAQGFKIFNEVIQTPGDGIFTFQGMQDHNAESIKSLEGFDRAWIEEAQTLSARSLSLLRPTIRSDGSEIWATWNPRRKNDPVDELLRGPNPPTDSIVIRANWSDNPFFPSVLEQERLDCLHKTPDQYDHIWEGGYATVNEGAYFVRELQNARKAGRITRITADPLLPIRLFADIGGTGAKADAFVFWAVQAVGREIRVLDYYEVQGQPIQHHLQWLRERGYTPGTSQIWLPHDGATQDKVYAVSYESAFRTAGYETFVIPNQGKGAAMQRIEALRRWLPACWFNAETTQPGLDALGWYHEKKDPVRMIGLGPEHDWSSHGSDAFGLMCVVVEELFDKVRPKTQQYHRSAGSWMG